MHCYWASVTRMWKLLPRIQVFSSHRFLFVRPTNLCSTQAMNAVVRKPGYEAKHASTSWTAMQACRLQTVLSFRSSTRILIRTVRYCLYSLKSTQHLCSKVTVLPASSIVTGYSYSCCSPRKRALRHVKVILKSCWLYKVLAAFL